VTDVTDKKGKIEGLNIKNKSSTKGIDCICHRHDLSQTQKSGPLHGNEPQQKEG
jgi:hypothetical protein